MSLKPLFPDDEFWQVEVKWMPPVAYDKVLSEGSPHDDDAYLYMIVAKHSAHPPKVVYLGRTCKQCVSVRLTQVDHKKRHAALVEKCPNHHLLVSHGLVTVKNGNLTERRIQDVERLLIYSNPDFEKAINVANFNHHNVEGSYWIWNIGHKAGLPSEVCLGVTARL